MIFRYYIVVEISSLCRASMLLGVDDEKHVYTLVKVCDRRPIVSAFFVNYELERNSFQKII